MNFGNFYNQTLGPMGFDITPNRFHAFWGEFDPEHGWDLRLEMPEITPKTLIAVHFPDFVTMHGSRVLELEKVEKFYGQHCDRVLVTYWTSDMHKYYNGPLNLIKFSDHNYNLCNELAANFDQWRHMLTQPRTHAWQCLNGRMCINRSTAANILKEFDNGWLSLGTDIKLPRFDYSNYFGCENYPNFLELAYVYGTAAVNIVNETQFFPLTGIVTEKTLLAIAAEQIPIVIGHQGIVEQCRQMGFDMFDDLVDTSYEQVENLDRVSAAIMRNEDLIRGRINLALYKKRLERNREYLLWEFPRKMEQDFITQARALADKLLPRYTP
jgi:hypothetical protein